MVIFAAQWYGTLPMWLTFAGVLGLAWTLKGGQIGPAVGYLREANTTLEQENRELTERLKERDREILALRSRTDLEPMQQALLNSMHTHEARAAERFDKTCIILDLIAERLGHSDA